MVIVTRATLENNGLLFLRDVLRHNLTDKQTPSRDPSAWIVKSPLKNEDIDPPMVILDSSSVNEDRVTFSGGIVTTLTVGIMVWSKSIQYRDELSDEIKAVFQDDSNTDGTNSMLSQGLTYLSGPSRNNDGYIQGYSELLRIKEMDLVFQFIQ